MMFLCNQPPAWDEYLQNTHPVLGASHDMGELRLGKACEVKQESEFTHVHSTSVNCPV